jgi:hypothetical protein
MTHVRLTMRMMMTRRMEKAEGKKFRNSVKLMATRDRSTVCDHDRECCRGGIQRKRVKMGQRVSHATVVHFSQVAV